VRNAAATTVRSIAGCLTEADRGGSWCQGNLWKNRETLQEPAALMRETDVAWTLPGATAGDLNGT